MEITKTENNATTVLSLSGRLDTTTAPQLQDILIPVLDRVTEIVLDFANLAYLSSAGLRVLLTGQKTAKAKNVSMIIRNVSEEIAEVFDMTGFSDILTIE